MINALLFGSPICCRVEYRSSGKETLIVSLRDDSNHALYEFSPRRIVKYPESVRSFTQKSDESPALEQIFPAEFIEKLCAELVGIETHSPGKSKELPPKVLQDRMRRRRELALPLGILLMADKVPLLTESVSTLSEASKADRQRAFQRILKESGSLPWKAAAPDSCRHWIYSLSRHEQLSCARIMRCFFSRQAAAGLCGDNPWNQYEPLSNTPEPSRKTILSTQNERTTLTEEDRRKTSCRRWRTAIAAM